MRTIITIFLMETLIFRKIKSAMIKEWESDMERTNIMSEHINVAVNKGIF